MLEPQCCVSTKSLRKARRTIGKLELGDSLMIGITLRRVAIIDLNATETNSAGRFAGNDTGPAEAGTNSYRKQCTTK